MAGAKWEESSAKLRHQHGFPRTVNVWTDNHALTNIPPNPRYRETVEIAFWFFKKKFGGGAMPAEKNCPDWVVDVTQGLERKAWGQIPPMLSQKNAPYIFSLDRVMDSEELPLKDKLLINPYGSKF